MGRWRHRTASEPHDLKSYRKHLDPREQHLKPAIPKTHHWCYMERRMRELYADQSEYSQWIHPQLGSCQGQSDTEVCRKWISFNLWQHF